MTENTLKAAWAEKKLCRKHKGVKKRIFAAAFGFIGLIFCIVYSDAVKSGVSAGIQMCLGVLIPSLFLPMTLCSFLQQSGVVSLIGRRIDRAAIFCFNISGTALAAFMLGCISGYPSGAVLSASLYRCGELDRNTAKRLCSVCVCAGPAFILLGVGDGLLHSRAAGYILLCSHIIAAFLLLFFSRFFVKKQKGEQLRENPQNSPTADNIIGKPCGKTGSFGFINALTAAVAKGASSMLGICAYTVLFSAVIAAVSELLPADITVFVTGVCEVTNACIYFSAHHNIPMIAAILGFSGLSVTAQVISAAKEVCDIKRLLLYRIMSAVISYAVCTLLLALFPQTVAAQNFGNVPMFSVSSGTMALSCLLVAGTAVFLYSLYQHSELDLYDFF